MNSSIHKLIRQLITAVLDVDKGPSVVLPPETRQQLVVELEQCLIDSERMEVYLRILQAVLQRQPRHDQTLSDERLKAVFRSGLSVLNDEELVRLALNPIALCQLFDWLTGGGEEMEYWEDLMCQAVLATHGLTLADVQAELEKNNTSMSDVKDSMPDMVWDMHNGNREAEQRPVNRDPSFDVCTSITGFASDHSAETTAKKLEKCGMDNVTANDIEATQQRLVESPLDTQAAASFLDRRPLTEVRRLLLDLRPSLVSAAASKPLPISSLPQSDAIELEAGGVLYCTMFHDSAGRVVVEFTTSSPQLKGRRILLTAIDEEDGKEILLQEPVPLGVGEDGVLSGKLDLTVLNLKHRHTIEYSIDMVSN